MAARAGTVAFVIAVAIATPALSQSFFNNWGRCTNARLIPDKRIEYCTRLLDNGGGVNSEITLLTILGGIYRNMHQYAKAIEYYSRALRYEALGVSKRDGSLASPDALVAAFQGRAEVYALNGQQDLAIADTAAIFRLAPAAADSYASRCRLRAVMKIDLDKALADCSEAMKLDARDTQVLGAAAFLQFRLGNLNQAQADCDAALNVDPRLAGALYIRGVIRLRSGDSAGGNADIAAAKEQAPTIAESFSDLGVSP